MGLGRDLTRMIRAPFLKGIGQSGNFSRKELAWDNNYRSNALNAAGTGVLPLVGTDAYDNILVAGGTQRQRLYPNVFQFDAVQTTPYTFAIIPARMAGAVVEAITLRYITPESTLTTQTMQVYRDPDGLVQGTGHALLSTGMATTSTANTVITGSLAGENARTLAHKDRLTLKLSGASTELRHVTLIVWTTKAGVSNLQSYRVKANASLADRCFYIANRDTTVREVLYCHATAGTHASAVTLQLHKDTSTDAPGAGTALLTNNSDAGFNCKGSNNTAQVGTLSATPANLRLAAGDRLSVNYTGTLTALEGVCVSVDLVPYDDFYEISMCLPTAAAGQLDIPIFVAKGNFQFIDGREVHSTAGSDGSAVNIDLDKDPDAGTVGAGTGLLTNNTNAGYDAKGTANTVQVAGVTTTLADPILRDTDAISVDYAGTVTALAGVTATIAVKPI